MFSICGVYPEGHEDGHTQASTLDDALKALRKLVCAAYEDPERPKFNKYVLQFEDYDAAGEVLFDVILDGKQVSRHSSIFMAAKAADRLRIDLCEQRPTLDIRMVSEWDVEAEKEAEADKDSE